jgi:hypothetical protein
MRVLANSLRIARIARYNNLISHFHIVELSHTLSFSKKLSFFFFLLYKRQCYLVVYQQILSLREDGIHRLEGKVTFNKID